MSSNLTEILSLAREAARQAGKVVLEKQGSSSVSLKAKNNLVTEADLAAQDLIIEKIKERFPEHSIIAEEEDLKAKSGDPDLWIIDPLDGTNNFAHTIPHFSISIAYARSGQVQAGVIYDPSRDEMFSASLTGGACLNDSSIRVSSAPSLNKAIIATGFYYDRGEMMRNTLSSIEKLFEANVHGVRRFGSAALDLCWVACGRFDAYFEYKLSIWDFAAGMLIVKESGGQCSDHFGNQLNLDSAGIVVSNGRLHKELLDIVAYR